VSTDGYAIAPPPGPSLHRRRRAPSTRTCVGVDVVGVHDLGVDVGVRVLGVLVGG
jgi:hypothetical protein